MICWLDGVFLPVDEARIDPRDRGFLLGDGIFETLLAVDGGVRHSARHMARLQDGAAIIGLRLPFSPSEIFEAMQRLLQENHLLAGRAAVRLTLTRGVGARGVAPPQDAAPTLLLTAAPAPAAPTAMRAILSKFLRSEKSISSKIKSLNYLDNILARREAVHAGVDEALMCNGAGRLASASAANLFLVQGGAAMTPAAEEGALPGIIRGVALETAARLKIPVLETRLERRALEAASEIFLTNALIGICPIVELDGRPIGNGQTGPVTETLRAQVRSDRG